MGGFSQYLEKPPKGQRLQYYSVSPQYTVFHACLSPDGGIVFFPPPPREGRAILFFPYNTH